MAPPVIKVSQVAKVQTELRMKINCKYDVKAVYSTPFATLKSYRTILKENVIKCYMEFFVWMEGVTNIAAESGERSPMFGTVMSVVSSWLMPNADEQSFTYL